MSVLPRGVSMLKGSVPKDFLSLSAKKPQWMKIITHHMLDLKMASVLKFNVIIRETL